jgi:hypothetical protein
MWPFESKLRKRLSEIKMTKIWGRIYFGGPQKSDIVIFNAHDPYSNLSFRYHADMTTKGLGLGLALALGLGLVLALGLGLVLALGLGLVLGSTNVEVLQNLVMCLFLILTFSNPVMTNV